MTNEPLCDSNHIRIVNSNELVVVRFEVELDEV